MISSESGRAVLNDQQLQAVLHNQGSLSIIAGPGTGKTKTLVSKIEYLLHEQHVNPKDIIALTFTNRAAQEMRNRVKQSLGEQQALPFIGTFHSLAHRLLSKNTQEIEIISEEDQRAIVKDLRKKHKRPESTRELVLAISQNKSRLVNAESNILPLLNGYNKVLQQLGRLDFDDLLLNAVQEVSQKYAYILVDEFQDTNEVQYALLKQLAAANAHICVIGDPLQSIYAFRGATPHSFEVFKKDFTSEEIVLTYNYRSGLDIIKTSHALFPSTLRLEAVQPYVGTVQLIKTRNEYSEAEYIVREMGRLMGGMDLNQAAEQRFATDEQARFADFAVIYRTHEIGRILEQQFAESGIPYQRVGSDETSQQKYDPVANKVTFLTMHAAKGLEFKYVFIGGFEDGLIPYTLKNVDINEEKRLLYVAMTRAKQGLYLLETTWRDKQKTVPSWFSRDVALPYTEDHALLKYRQKQEKLRVQRQQLKLF